MSIGDAIYHMNWPSLSVNERKELLMIMLRSTLPMKFTSSFLITLSLQSYSSVRIALILCYSYCKQIYPIFCINIFLSFHLDLKTIILGI